LFEVSFRSSFSCGPPHAFVFQCLTLYLWYHLRPPHTSLIFFRQWVIVLLDFATPKGLTAHCKVPPTAFANFPFRPLLRYCLPMPHPPHPLLFCTFLFFCFVFASGFLKFYSCGLPFFRSLFNGVNKCTRASFFLSPPHSSPPHLRLFKYRPCDASSLPPQDFNRFSFRHFGSAPLLSVLHGLLRRRLVSRLLRFSLLKSMALARKGNHLFLDLPPPCHL